MRDRYRALDRVELRARTDAPTATAGDRLGGHEFHSPNAGVDSDGLIEYQTPGTYRHVHAESNPLNEFLASL